MRSFLVIAAAALTLTPAAKAQVLFDSGGFEAPYIPGTTLIGQQGWSGIDGTASSYTVQAGVGVGGTQAVQLNDPLGGQSWAWPPINYTAAAGEFVRVQVDIAQGTPDPALFTAYGIEVYTEAVVQTTRYGLFNDAGTIRPFVVSFFDEVTGQFDPDGVLSFVSFDVAVAPNTFMNFDAELNYTTKTLRLFLDGTDVGANIPFMDPTVVDFGDADFQIDVDPAAPNSGFIDNYRISVVTTPVPEPATCGLAAVAAGLVFAVRRRQAARRVAARYA